MGEDQIKAPLFVIPDGIGFVLIYDEATSKLYKIDRSEYGGLDSHLCLSDVTSVK